MKPFYLAVAAMMCAGASWSARAQEQDAAACPEMLPAETRCYSGQVASGAFYWIAIPREWNRTLVVHAHGGPRGEPDPEETREDLERFAVTVREGYAWIASTYRRGGYGVRMAAEDTEAMRALFWQRFGRPDRTLVHGQSWGGNVAAKLAELYAIDASGAQVYDGVILTSGLIAGGTRAYDFRADLRAVYQYYCGNHPRPEETQYPVWQGLPAGQAMKRSELEARVDECTGLDTPAEQRSDTQKRNLANILGVIPIEEDSLVSHLSWATNTFADLVNDRLDGRNPFSTEDVRYTGSDDDDALNAGVARFAADPWAVARLAYDSDMSGLIVLPTLTLHALHDPTVFASQERVYHDVVAHAGRSDLLVQTFTDETTHSKLSTPQYAALFAAMDAWLDRDEKPDRLSVEQLCQDVYAKRYDEPCRFTPAEPDPPPPAR
ncbi:alpha/beta hydrolase family protein [Marinivivus vitaminiproducens]|uniref:alpha/beta hydrolase family protein n=1 Tax=Marinivivus vitaminiproducens TaxID=3035935 RepID=UPI00279F1E2F|nr:hypothetical protein P4R82_15490 [Geminicoccaceae bacterium SCSIO 64248]